MRIFEMGSLYDEFKYATLTDSYMPGLPEDTYRNKANENF